MLLLALSFFILIMVIAESLSDSESTGWTYRTDTSADCDGTPDNLCGPQYWGNLYPGCASETINQSPLNLAQATINTSMTPPTYDSTLGCSSWIQGADTAHFYIDFASAGCYNLTLKYNGEDYYLSSMHFHSPSEHTIGGGFHSAEAHLLHYSKSSEDILYVGILLEGTAEGLPGTNNTFLNQIWNADGGSIPSIAAVTYVPSSPTGPQLNPYNELFPGSYSYFSYTGSTTSPPCIAGARWIIFADPVPISQDDLNILRATLPLVNGTAVSSTGNNNRPLQPIDQRKISFSYGVTLPTLCPENNDDNDDSNLAAFRVAVAAMLISLVCLISACYFIWKLHCSSSPSYRGKGDDKLQDKSHLQDHSYIPPSPRNSLFQTENYSVKSPVL